MNPILQNILLGISIAAPIGPASIAIIHNGITGGFLTAIQVAIGVVLADITFVFIAFFGLASFITIPVVKITILFFGVAVLMLLSYRTIREALSNQERALPGRRPVSRNKVIEGYAVNISNPLAAVWWLGLIGSILASSNQQARSGAALLLTLTIVIGIFIWHTTISVVSHFSKRFLNSSLIKYISIASAIILFVFALRFGYLALSLT